MPTTTYRWRVIQIGTDPRDKVWKMTGKVLGWAMDEESARVHEMATGRKLAKVPGSEEVRADLYGPQGYGANIPPGPNNRED